MMDLSEKQSALAGYLVERLGFQKGPFLDHYLYCLSYPDLCRNLLHLLRENEKLQMERELGKSLSWDEYRQKLIHRDYPGDEMDWDEYKRRKSEDHPGFYYSRINPLMGEYIKKKNRLWKLHKHEDLGKDYVTASDLMSLQFCPAAFSINNTYQQISTPSAQTGTRFHEKALLDLQSTYGVGGRCDFNEHRSLFDRLRNQYNSAFFDDIRTSVGFPKNCLI